MKTKQVKRLVLSAFVVCAAAASKAANLAGNMYWTVEGVESTSGKPMSEETPYTAYYFYLLDSWSAADLNSKMADIESRIVNRDVSSWASDSLNPEHSQHLSTQTSSTGSFTDNFATYRATSHDSEGIVTTTTGATSRASRRVRRSRTKYGIIHGDVCHCGLSWKRRRGAAARNPAVEPGA